MDWQKIVEQPAALAAGGVIGAAVIAVLGTLVTLLANRKRRPDRLRDALVTDVDLLEKLPKGSEAYAIMRETVDHTASSLAIEQRRGNNNYYALLSIFVPILVFAELLVLSTTEGIFWGVGISIAIGYALGRLQSWLLKWIERERTASGMKPLDVGIVTRKLRAAGKGTSRQE